ncbi:MAG: CRISPR system precrRNA processing endoribonuclease RAMP protein Cas6 [Chloroflexota bacterium]
MLYSTALEISPAESAGVGPGLGYQCYSLILDIIRTGNPSLSNSLHSALELKPLTVSNLLHPDGRALRTPILTSGQRYAIRATFLTDDVFTAFMHGTALKGPDSKLMLGNAACKLVRSATMKLQSPLCGNSSFEDLMEKAAMERQISLRFLSPTVFRSKGNRNTLRPDARLIFNSYLTRWNAFSPVKLDSGWLTWCSEYVRLDKYRLSTQKVDFGSYQETGLVGECTFSAPGDAPPEMLSALNALADFAWYAGTGAKTTMGMGQTRRWWNGRALSGGAGRQLTQRQ